MQKVVELPARCHVLDNLYAWLTSRMKILTVFFVSLSPLGIFSHQLCIRLLPTCAEWACSFWSASQQTGCLPLLMEGKEGSQKRQAKKEGLSNTAQLQHQLISSGAWGCQHLQSCLETRGNLRGRGKWSISAVLIQPSCSLSLLNDHCRALGEEAIYASSKTHLLEKIIALNYQLTIVSCMRWSWIFSFTIQLKKRKIRKYIKGCLNMSLKLAWFWNLLVWQRSWCDFFFLFQAENFLWVFPSGQINVVQKFWLTHLRFVNSFMPQEIQTIIHWISWKIILGKTLIIFLSALFRISL